MYGTAFNTGLYTRLATSITGLFSQFTSCFHHSVLTGLYNHSAPLPTNRGGFVPQRSDESDDILSNVPTDSIPVVIVTALSLVAGSASVVFFCVVFVVVSWRICKRERRYHLNLHTRSHTADSESQPLELYERD